MKTVLMMLLPLLVLYAGQQVSAWGGLFNRFSPELLSNLGYGGFGAYRHLPLNQKLQNPVEAFEQLIQEEEEEEPCYGKKCTANEHCCPGSVCVDVDGILGSCLPAYGNRQGEACRQDGDCETGLICTGSAEGARACQPPLAAKKQYSEDCTMSSECDISKGLCCQLQRRHRQAPRKVCSYFKDPLICIGPVAVDQVKEQVQHTAGEKRITGKAGMFNHLK